MAALGVSWVEPPGSSTRELYVRKEIQVLKTVRAVSRI